MDLYHKLFLFFIQTHKKLKTTTTKKTPKQPLVIRIKQHANVRSNPLFPATKRHLKNS